MPDTERVIQALDESITQGFQIEHQRARGWRLIAVTMALLVLVAMIFLIIDNAHQSTTVTRLSNASATLAQIDHRTQLAASALRFTVKAQQSTIVKLTDQISNDNLFADLFRQLIVASIAKNQAEVHRIEIKLKKIRFVTASPPVKSGSG